MQNFTGITVLQATSVTPTQTFLMAFPYQIRKSPSRHLECTMHWYRPHSAVAASFRMQAPTRVWEGWPHLATAGA